MKATDHIHLRQVAKTFMEGERRRVVFAALDARFDAGAITAVVGRSGAGKSTLLNLLSGIDLPDAGEVIVAGQSLGRLSDRQRTVFRRRHVGFVFQSFNLIPTLTVEENLLLPLELLGADMDGARARVLELLERLGLADRAHSFPDRLSGGEQQRVAVARALAHRPTLVLADEPTGNLDKETGANVLRWLTELTHEHGTTLILVTHSDEVLAHADTVLELDSGQLVARDPVS